MDALNSFPRRRVLVVDDSKEITSLVADMLTPDGIDVVVANEVCEAMTLLKFASVDLVITDIMMPGPSGTKLLNYIRNSRPDLLKKTIVMTAYRYDDRIVQRLEQESIPYVFKPFEVDVFMGLVRQTLEEDPTLAA